MKVLATITVRVPRPAPFGIATDDDDDNDHYIVEKSALEDTGVLSLRRVRSPGCDGREESQLTAGPVVRVGTTTITVEDAQ